MATPATTNDGFFTRVRNFLDEVYFEMTKKVTWPTKEELKAQTQVTVILLAVVALIILLYDKVFEAFVLLILNLTQ
jgi:preprotein translocase SecE subunit